MFYKTLSGLGIGVPPEAFGRELCDRTNGATAEVRKARPVTAACAGGTGSPHILHFFPLSYILLTSPICTIKIGDKGVL